MGVFIEKPVPQKYIKFKTLVKDNFDWQYNADVAKDAFAPVIHGQNPTTPNVVAHVTMGPRCASHHPNIEPGGDGGMKTPGK